MIDLAAVKTNYGIWKQKKDSMRAREAADNIMECLPEWIEETRRNRLILEESKPRIGW